jgi:hypothetical protein
MGVTLEEVVAVDNNVVVTETRSDDDIVNSLLNKDTDGENSESDDDPVLNDVPVDFLFFDKYIFDLCQVFKKKFINIVICF